MHISGGRFIISPSALCSLIAVVVFVVDPVTCSEMQDGPLGYPRWVHLEGGPSGALPKPSTGGNRLTKREAYRFQGHIQCSEVSVEGKGTEDRTVKEIKTDSYKFFLRPKEDFRKIVFRMLIDNTFDVQPPYIYGNYLAISRGMLERDSTAEEDEWREFHVKYYKHEVTMGRDKLALQVTVGNKTRPLITRRWWRTHTYSGFQISVEGGADFLFDCATHEIIHNAPPVAEAGQPLLLWGILGPCFLVFIAGWALFLVLRHRRRNYEQAPPVPDLPKSLLLGMDKVNHSPDADHHIYDEFDEDTLSRLRQKLNATTLGNAVDSPTKKPYSQHQQLIPAQKAVENEYDIPRSVSLRASAREEEEDKSSALLVRQQERVYMNEGGLSLLEEKIKATSGIRDSMPETHYIEMNGIVNIGSVDVGQSQRQ